MTTQARAAGPALAVGALGVVFGDIGTSPLYAFRAILGGIGGLDRSTVYGLTSIVIWSMTIVVSVLYVGTLTSMDHDGDGGLLALVTLVRKRGNAGVFAAATMIGILGAALFLGDSLITPAISVLSAAEGVKVANPGLSWIALPGAVAILLCVFLLQHVGSGRIGSFYGPVMLAWFLTIAGFGAASISRTPTALEALSPTWAVTYFWEHPAAAFLSLGAVVLTITGAEALYADLGHFDRRSITQGWFFLVFPALVIAYLGEAAAVQRSPAAASQPFYAVVPEWGTIAVLLLATIATIIASEATIAGAFTVLNQAGGLGLIPSLRVRHPASDGKAGQIYIPAANWALCGGVLAIVLGFRTSEALASAYGVAVSGTILTTVILGAMLSLRRGAHLRLVVIAGCAVAALLFAAATSPKIVSGGWLPLIVAAVLFTVMSTWRAGRTRLRDQRHQLEHSREHLTAFLGGDLARRDGSAVFLSDNYDTTPLALAFVIDQEHQIPRATVILSWQVEDTPNSPPHEETLRIESLGPGVTTVAVTLGYRDHFAPEAVMRDAQRHAPELLDDFDPATAIFYLSEERPLLTKRGHLPRWQQRLFSVINRLAPDHAEALTLPRDRTVVLSRELPL